jgi:DNA repair exonuclease SbcCD ATPase subunit
VNKSEKISSSLEELFALKKVTEDQLNIIKHQVDKMAQYDLTNSENIESDSHISWDEHIKRVADAETDLKIINDAQHFKQRLPLQDGCPGCAATRRAFSEAGLADCRMQLNNARKSLLIASKNKYDNTQHILKTIVAQIQEAEQAKVTEAVDCYVRASQAREIAEAKLKKAEAIDRKNALIRERADIKICEIDQEERNAAKHALDAIRTMEYALLKKAEAINRRNALNRERAVLKIFEADQNERNTARRALDAIHIMECAAYWWYEDKKAWEQYEITQAIRRQLDNLIETHTSLANAYTNEVREKSNAIAKAIEIIQHRKFALQSIKTAQAKVIHATKFAEIVKDFERLKHEAEIASKERAAAENMMATTRNQREELQKKRSALQVDTARLAERIAFETKRDNRKKELEAKKVVIEAYRQVLSPTSGIASVLLIRAREGLESTINMALAEVDAPFRAILNEKFDLHIQTTATTTERARTLPIGLGSGYQRFVLGLAARRALWTLAEVPLPDASIIDEGFASCDDERLGAVADHLVTAASASAAALVAGLPPSLRGPRLHFAVSHVEALKIRLERPLAITRITGYSHVTNILAVITRTITPDTKRMATVRSTILQDAKRMAIASSVTQDTKVKSAEKATTQQNIANVARLPPDPNKAGNVWCAACDRSFTAGRAVGHLQTAGHKKAAQKYTNAHK